MGYYIYMGPLLLHMWAVLQVRQTAVSYDMSTVLACCEDGTIWRWDSARAPESDEGSQDEQVEDSNSSTQSSEEGR